MSPGRVLCREGRVTACSCPRGPRGLVPGVARGSPPRDLSPPGPRLRPRPARRRPGTEAFAGVRAPPRPPGRANGAAPGNLPHAASGRRGTCSAPPAPECWAVLLARPPGRSRASRPVPEATLPNGDGGGLRSGASRPGQRPAQPARGSPTPALPGAGAASRGPSPPRRPYLVRRPQQPVDPGQLGAEREVLAEREQRRPAGLGEVGAVERVRVVQELHPASQRGHDASLLRRARAPGSAGRRPGRGVTGSREAAATAGWLAGWLAGSAFPAAARAPAAGGRGGGGAGGPPRAPRAPPARAPPPSVP